jgi:hypothetical protein
MGVGLRSWTAILLVAVGASLVAANARAAVWPGPAPCNGSLQTCIDGVAAGSTVQLSNAIADESLLINKSLTLQPVLGRLGVIGGGPTTRSIRIVDGPGGARVKVLIQDLILENAAIDVNLNAGSGHEVTIRGSSIRNEALTNATRAIDLDLRVPATATVESNDIESNGYGLSVFTSLSTGSVSAVLRDNRITGRIPVLSASGIDVDLRGAGSVDVDLHNNVVHGVATCNCGGAAGIEVAVFDTVSATVDIIHNTIDAVASAGVSVRTPGASVSAAVQVFNNLVTNSDTPVEFPPFSPALLVSSGFNDFFGNDFAALYGGYPAGAGVISEDPLYLNAGLGDYHLNVKSQAVDAGTGVPPGGLPIFDADGKARTIGAFPDPGAFEAPEPGAATSAANVVGMLAALVGRRRDPTRAR